MYRRRGMRSVMAQEAAHIRIQLDEQALNAVPVDERAGLEVTEDTSPTAEDLKARSRSGTATINGHIFWTACLPLLRQLPLAPYILHFV
jgi:hypothetical protein